MTQSNVMLEGGLSWSQRVMSLYEEGASDAEVAGSLRVPLKVFYQQLADNAAFAELVNLGRTLSQAYWEGLARKNVGNKGFNSSLYSFYMKNRHGWADKVESVTTNENTNLNLDELRNRVQKEVANLARLQAPELSDAQRVLATSGGSDE